MKSVLISIQPKWVEKIVKGEKTIEIRKTRPKLETPFKCYIYCTYGKENENYMLGKRGKVIGEFVCDRIDTVASIRTHCMDYITVNDKLDTHLGKISCLNVDELGKYLGFNKDGYGWHISDLKIYDKPKPIMKFYKPCPIKLGFKNCPVCELYSTYTGCCMNNIDRPPQSWCYVEEFYTMTDEELIQDIIDGERK